MVFTGIQKRNCDTFIFGGDFFDIRHSIGVSTLNYAMDALEMINNAFDRSYFILGNHDLAFRQTREISSVVVARNFKNIEIITEPVYRDEILLLPWLVGDESKSINKYNTRYTFAHLEIPGFMMNSSVSMPDSPHATKLDQFESQELVFTGHFHRRQQIKNIFYTGNVYPFDFSDAWDADKGAMFLDWGGKPEMVAWDRQPLFRNTKLSDLLNDPDSILTKNLTARVMLDIDISYEEASALKDAFIDQYGLRKVELIPMSIDVDNHDFNPGSNFQSVDQIVIEGLKSIQSNDVRREKLIEIYDSLTIE